MTARRRIGGRAAICLLLGLLSTVAVAWACTALIEVNQGARDRAYAIGKPIGQGAYPHVRVESWARPGAMRVEVRAGVDSAEVIRDWSWLEVALPNRMTQVAEIAQRMLPTDRKCQPEWSAVRDIRGWPWPALWSQIDSDSARRVDMSAIGPLDAALPLRPDWLWFSIDTLVFAAVWFVAMFGSSATRLAVRRRRRLCLRCGYARAGLGPDAPCPECGTKPEVSE